ncbi:DeoR/GlpR family DNA-binding transcription regulator [Bacillus sp. V5-8f]|uniref:DeoR/GlpR family DNA-binding transcription regulator n=1 Tax=Bacillus sp. V5-8f TaxID=2053044 RepID=UPI000C7586E5|nr:DeoR/GlpR family DNA-binding transcription regulator [Bacillus sp. V5-8f]PLT33729.1 transcriptional regulator [Bacillus sp. V5-8f]
MSKMLIPERHKMILEILNKQQKITVKELSKEISVSEATLRTDLTKMEQDGLLVRTHGGAVLTDYIENETSFSVREQKNKNEKYMIAKKAAEIITNGRCIMLDASSTALELARILKNMQVRLTVVTSGINTATELSENPNITVILLGGVVKGGSNRLEGNLGASILNQIHVDIFFTSANGFSFESGLLDFSVYEVELKRAMVQSSQKVAALLDHSKIHKNSIASFASINEIDIVISDYPLSKEEDRMLNEKGIDYMFVPNPQF